MSFDGLCVSGLCGQLRFFLELLRGLRGDVVRWLSNASCRSARCRHLLINGHLDGQSPLGGIRLGGHIRVVVKLGIGGRPRGGVRALKALFSNVRLQRLKFFGELFEELLNLHFQRVLGELILGGRSLAHLRALRGSTRSLLAFGRAVALRR